MHDLHQAQAVRAWAAAGHHRVALHALDAARLGAGFWRGVEEALGQRLVIECGTQAGAVLESLRAGLRQLHYNLDAASQAPALDDLVRAHGGTRVKANAAWQLVPGRPASAQLARLRFGEVTAALAAGTRIKTQLTERSAEIQRTGLVACD